jgi:hypothetical protein
VRSTEPPNLCGVGFVCLLAAEHVRYVIHGSIRLAVIIRCRLAVLLLRHTRIHLLTR